MNITQHLGRKQTRKHPAYTLGLVGWPVLVNGNEVGFVWDKMYGSYDYKLTGSTRTPSARSRKHAVEMILSLQEY